MKIEMQPASGVVAFDFMDKPYPVLGWYSEVLESGGMKLLPLVLNKGELVPLDDSKVRYSVVGVSEQWWGLVARHQAQVYRSDGA